VDSISTFVDSRIENNDSLFNLTGLDNLQHLGYSGAFRITENNNLLSLDGLENVEHADDIRLIISNNAQLSDISGLGNLQTIKNIHFSENHLNNIELPSLTNIHKEFSIFKENHLKTLTGLITLDTIGTPPRQGELTIWFCDSLLNLNGLENIFMKSNSIIKLEENPALENIDALETLSITSGAVIDITDNYSLSNIKFDNVIEGRIRFNITNNENLNTISFANLNYIDGDNISGISNAYDEDLPEPTYQGGADYTYGIRIQDNPNLTTLNFPVLERVEGDMRIYNNPKISNLNQFYSLQVVNRHFHLNHLDDLENLEGLENLRWIGGDFSLGGFESSLTQLCDFVSLDSINRSVYISGNKLLTDLNGLETLQIIGGSLSLSGDSLLNSISPLNQVDSIGWKKEGFVLFRIKGADHQLDSIHLSSTVRINPEMDVKIIENGNLKSIKAPSVEQLRILEVMDNPNLVNLELPNLTVVGTDSSYANATQISIKQNPLLVSLDGISNITHIQDSIVIGNNLTLSNCESICYMQDAGVPTSKFHIYNNNFPCGSLTDINENICDSLTDVSIFFNDKFEEIITYPNPTNGTFRLSIESEQLPSYLHIYDTFGRELKYISIESEYQEVNIFSLPSGFYYLKLKGINSWGNVLKID
jgi:hypothetical protein